jgi:hypothetical protein
VTVMSPVPVLFQSVLTFGVFPFMAWFLARAQHAIIRPLDV